MEYQDSKKFLPNIIPAGIIIVIFGGLFIFAFVRIFALTKRTNFLATELASTTATLSQKTIGLSQDLANLRSQTLGLSDTLSQNINDVKSEVGGVAQTVGTLQKLQQTDSELLRKYSKIYFMNENYRPAHLTDIPADNLYSKTRSEQFLTEAWPFLKNMLDAAKSNGVALYIKSAYRSFGEQQSIKSSFTVVYGAGTANSFSADQGYSEHQLGTTVDFITSGTGGMLDESFDKTVAYQWLLNNAHRYGFALSYPKGNNYYVYEPWHWRFVGVRLATNLRDNKLNFYDVDQRQIDNYLVNIFD